MRIDVWSDLVCPWCYIGRRRLALALDHFPHADEVEIAFRSFQLNPGAPIGPPRLQVAVLIERYGLSEARARELEAETARTAQAEGLEYRSQGALSGNTFDAHRLVHLARDRGLEAAMVDRLYRAHFAEQRSLFDQGSLVELASEVGIDRSQAATALATRAYSEPVLEDAQEAARLGVTGVPFTLMGHRYAISGAQSPTVFLGALNQAWEEDHIKVG
ncbi:MAG: DsbA family oxidoreductase [Candidatus Dormiibacterota bacterium]